MLAAEGNRLAATGAGLGDRGPCPAGSNGRLAAWMGVICAPAELLEVGQHFRGQGQRRENWWNQRPGRRWWRYSGSGLSRACAAKP